MKRTGGLITACACILACLLFTAGLFLAGVFPRPDTSEHQKDENTASLKKFNVLLLGSDARPGEKVGNTDTIMVAQVSPERIAILSIPRDTRVEIPGKGTQKINSAARYGGPELTAAVVSDLIGVDVDKYVLVRWEGFIKIVDILGGVTVDVPRDMNHDSGDGEEYIIDLKKGRQKLNGRQALAFARFRNEALGDDRPQRTAARLDEVLDRAGEKACHPAETPLAGTAAVQKCGNKSRPSGAPDPGQGRKQPEKRSRGHPDAPRLLSRSERCQLLGGGAGACPSGGL